MSPVTREGYFYEGSRRITLEDRHGDLPYTQALIVRNNSRLLARLSVLVVLATVASPIARAAEYEVPPQLQISILLKVLVYDRSLASRSRDGLTLGVVFDPRSESSRACRDAFSQAFKE